MYKIDKTIKDELTNFDWTRDSYEVEKGINKISELYRWKYRITGDKKQLEIADLIENKARNLHYKRI